MYVYRYYNILCLYCVLCIYIYIYTYIYIYMYKYKYIMVLDKFHHDLNQRPKPIDDGECKVNDPIVGPYFR